ncbi:MAG: endolytic transglycosylase MltG [Bacteroidia bacterium]|nr:MAG: endolytic transglycosylase MltG [Bacteroidia bacterium]
MKRLLSLVLYVTLIVALMIAISTWRSFFSHVDIIEGGTEIYIPHGASYEDVKDTLRNKHLLVNETAFDLLAKRKRYTENIKPGHYVVTDMMSYNDMMNLLRSGNQTPVRITFNNIRTIPDLAGRLAGQIEIDSVSVVRFLLDKSNYDDDGFSPETVISVFIPDTYEVYWSVSARELYDKMLSEYNLFWNESRRAKAIALGLTPVEVSTLASIIDDEVNKPDEKPTIAGVYLNRLKLNMPLQACPTIKFALNDFTIRRVLNVHLTVDSPYNTYKNTGLPPGPVRCPTKEGIEAVLVAEEHDYLFFVAKYDFSGYHHFSTTLKEHNSYANRYQQELDRRKIYN